MLKNLPIFIVASLALTAPDAVGQQAPAVAVIRDVSVLNQAGTGWLPRRDVIVRGAIIESIAPTGGALPESEFEIKGAGKFVVPGRFASRALMTRLSQRDGVARETRGSAATISAGAAVDLIVLTADPLQPRSVPDVDAVIFRGEVLTRAHLNQLLSQPRKDQQ